MVLKLINATEAKPGVVITYEGNACAVKSQDISKTGKHGASKVRMEAIGVVDGKKRVITVPGHERFEVPLIKKMKGQVLSVGEKVSLMDLENFETYDVIVPEDIRPELKEGDNVEYWDVEGIKVIKRKM
jgi:translation initiation factor 5A